MGESTTDTPLADGAPVPLAPVVAEDPPIDEETLKEVCDIAVDLWGDLRDAIVRAVASTEFNDRAVADEAVASQQMSERLEKTMRKGAFLCAKKYSMRMEYAPEVMLGGAFVLSAGQTALIVRGLKAKGAERRARAKEQKEQKT